MLLAMPLADAEAAEPDAEGELVDEPPDANI